jgi:serine/threonine protein kinase
MSVQKGARVGPYRVDDRIGVGGMGEVYAATDTRLQRRVAIKILPSSLAKDPQRRARLQREAELISSLHHPHVCRLYDVGQTEDGAQYLVLELLEGDTLQARLRSGPLPPAQVLRIASQIADALAAAHRHGIVHGDLKPGNVMLTSDGAKLLDFGLAKPLVASPLSLTIPRWAREH